MLASKFSPIRFGGVGKDFPGRSLLFKLHMGKNRKSSTFFLIFSVPEVTKMTVTRFSEGIN